MTENGNKEALKWIGGVLITIAISVGGYSINLNMQNEARITKMETEMAQMRSEIDDIWTKYNMAVEEKEKVHVRLTLIEAKWQAMTEGRLRIQQN